MYHKITNPLTNRKVSVNSKIGKNIIMNYVTLLTGGNYPGHCDGNPTQCMDVIATSNCNSGGGRKKMKGGNYPGHCDGNPTQCMDVIATSNCNSGGGRKNNR